MLILVALVGLVTALAGLIGVVSPSAVLGWVSRKFVTPRWMWLAVLRRVGMGVLLIVASSRTRFPNEISILGWVTLISGVGLAIMGLDGARRLLKWWMDRPPAVVSIAFFFVVLFGAFLVYAAI